MNHCLLTHFRNFIPDSGRLTHLQIPTLSDTVRVDAGFVAGDEVSSHYDPMIAKLIVQGSTREIAIQKLHASLNEYEIAGPITNVEFLKRVCLNPAFVAGDVETGFIAKRKDFLFQEFDIPLEVYAQAALGTFLLEATALQSTNLSTFGGQSGFVSSFQNREYKFIPNKADGTTDAIETAVRMRQLSLGLFEISISGTTYASVASHYDSKTHTVSSYFPHTRLETRLIVDGGSLTLFQHGQQYRLRTSTPKWMEKALGIKDHAHSVLAPMPCKVLRVEVSEGDQVKKDQVLVVIESMKMETVIRSPQDGTVSRVVHRQGVCIIILWFLKAIRTEWLINEHVGSMQGWYGIGGV